MANPVAEMLLQALIWVLRSLQSPPGIVQHAIEVAVKHGYRYIDCAFLYENEGAIGEGLQNVFKKGLAKREDLFIVSKPEDVKPALLETLKLLQLDYLDMYLMHSPMGIKNVKGELLPQKDGKVIMSDVDYLDTWKAERHVYQTQSKLIPFVKGKGLVYIAYSPLTSPQTPFQNPEHIIENTKVFDFCLTDEEMKKLASLHYGARAVPWDLLGLGHHKHYPFSKDE
ncbi:hypothetical protein JD844_030928 [Phrynosoma platyrhinos]|uniref:NADP-dependent oxidoreductase domain-containing protein n=1 Tax=Phrynosoma platyrhinos TaxID=52577 RepID=A0ABQ7T0I1_PHRPL|nr:hypothetical protein JD844_030928 [Phrynosoma platyrhinos]